MKNFAVAHDASEIKLGGTYEMNLQDTSVLANIDLEADVDAQPDIDHEMLEDESLVSDFKRKLKRKKMAQKREFDRDTRNYEAIANDFFFEGE